MFQPPKAPPFPNKLPLEDQVDAALNRAAQVIEGHPLTQRLRRFEEQLPEMESIDFPTPLGTIRTPHVQPPSASPPKINERERLAVKAALAQDLASIIGMVPIVGDPIADVIEDTYFMVMFPFKHVYN